MKCQRIQRWVSALLAIALVVPLLTGCTPNLDNKTVSGTLNEEAARVGSDTLSLSMGEFPLSGEAKCEIKQVQAPELEGVDVQAFDFSVETQEELLSVMELTIPYDENALEGMSPEGNIGAAYYNEETAAWEPVSFTINAAEGTVTIYTDHLSTYGCFIINNENTRRAYAAYAVPAFAMSAMDDYDIDADAIVANTAQNGGEPGPDAIEAGLTIMDRGLAIGSAGIDTISHSLNSLTGVTGAAKGNSLLNGIGDKVGSLGTTCAIAQVAYGMYNVYNGDTNAVFPCYAEALKGSLSYVAGKAGMKLVSLSFLGVLCIEYSINKFGETAWSGRQDIYEKAYSLYYESPGVKRDARDWASEFLRARETAASPERYQIRIDGLVQRYVDQFWQDELTVAAYQDEAQAVGFTGGGGLNERMKEEISAAYKNHLFKGVIQDAFRLIAEKDARNAERDLLKELNAIRAELNRVCTLELYDGSLSDEKPTSDAAETQVFVTVPDNITDPESWRTVLAEKGDGQIKFTVLGYLMAGAPSELRLYEKDASTDDAPTQTISFTMEDVLQRVDIGVSGLPLEEILGSYEGQTDVIALSVSDEGYQYYLNNLHSSDEDPLARADCDAALAEAVDENSMRVSSIVVSSDAPESGRCIITATVVTKEDGNTVPLAVDAEYRNGVLVLQGESGESIVTPIKQPDGSIHLAGQNVQFGCYEPDWEVIAYYLTLSLDLVKVS